MENIVKDHELDLESYIPKGWGKSSRGKPITIEPHPKIMDELAEYLIAKGHTCVCIVGTKNHEFKWCGKDVCPNIELDQTTKETEVEIQQFIQKLRDDGHSCIGIGERQPLSVSWCEKEICIYNQQKNELVE